MDQLSRQIRMANSDLDFCQSSNSDNALVVNNVCKSYGVWKNPSARLKVPLLNAIKKRASWLQSIVNTDVSSLYYQFNALNNISFDLPRGTSMAVIGRNGSGKSTLLQIIAGTLQASQGDVTRNGRIAALLELGSGFNPEFSGRANVYMNGAIYGLSSEEVKARMEEVEDFAEIGTHIDQPVKTYSSGMMMRLAFSVQVLIDPDILIVDEALSVGDIFFQQKCFDRMRRLSAAGTSILFVSHDLVSVSQFTEIAMVLNRGDCVFFGKSSVAVKEYQVLERENAFAYSNRQSNTAVKSADPSQSKGLEPRQSKTKQTQDSSSILPSEYAFIDIDKIIQVGKDRAEFTAIAVFNEEGEPATVFEQGSRLFVQCEIMTHIVFECLSVGISIKDRTNVFVHGKHSIQHGIRPMSTDDNSRLIFQFCFELEIAIGQYTMDIGIIDINQSIDNGIQMDQMEANMIRICLNDGFYSFQVSPRSTYKYLQLPFYGISDLNGECSLMEIVTPDNS
jgi:lipopolysaccharide transport system ATP-binding protein